MKKILLLIIFSWLLVCCKNEPKDSNTTIYNSDSAAMANATDTMKAMIKKVDSLVVSDSGRTVVQPKDTVGAK